MWFDGDLTVKRQKHTVESRSLPEPTLVAECAAYGELTSVERPSDQRAKEWTAAHSTR